MEPFEVCAGLVEWETRQKEQKELLLVSLRIWGRLHSGEEIEEPSENQEKGKDCFVFCLYQYTEEI